MQLERTEVPEAVIDRISDVDYPGAVVYRCSLLQAGSKDIVTL